MNANTELNNTWNLLNVIRDVFGIAKGGNKPTHAEAIQKAQTLAPKVFHDNLELIQEHKEPEIVKQYRQRAMAQNEDPKKLLKEEINRLKSAISRTSGPSDALHRQRRRLERASTFFSMERLLFLEEDQVLRHDFHIPHDGAELKSAYGIHRDFAINGNKILRVRMAHPTKVERLLGSDLIYEVFDRKTEKMRFIHLQYKVWDEDTLYWSQAKNLAGQLNKMKSNFCDQQYCYGEFKDYDNRFRCPFCCAFLRPTDKLVDVYSPLKSSSLHLQVCQVDKYVRKETGNKILKRADFENAALSSSTFDELFKKNLIGSRWLTAEEVDRVYQGQLLMGHEENFKVHVTEYRDDLTDKREPIAVTL